MRAALEPAQRAHGERGSALVEFAMGSTIALTVLFGIIDCGRALYTYHAVSNAARLGSRYAIVHGSSCALAGCPVSASALQTYVRDLTPAIDANSLTVTPAWATAPGCPGAPFQAAGCQVTVTVTYPFTFAVPILPNLKMNMSSASVMTISQ
jgi:Flp pilus assembly protein TadG